MLLDTRKRSLSVGHDTKSTSWCSMTSSHQNRHTNPNDSPSSYRTLISPGQAEIKIRRSRFLATVAAASDLITAKQVVAEVASRYHDCRHVCYAWRGGIGPQLQEVRHDAGEPAGTAGEPILAVLRGAELTDCVAVVARYFGGIKLGTGPLARAYGQATEEALQLARSATIQVGREFRLDFNYSHQKTVANLVNRHGGRLVQEGYGSRVQWSIWLPVTNIAAFSQDLTTASAGKIELKALTEGPGPS